MEFDFVPEPSTRGLIWDVSESRFGSLLCDMNVDAAKSCYFLLSLLVTLLYKGQTAFCGRGARGEGGYGMNW